jgi:hypothetical protein
MQDAIISPFRDGGNLLAAILFLIKNIRFNFEISKDTSFYIQSVASKYMLFTTGCCMLMELLLFVCIILK